MSDLFEFFVFLASVALIALFIDLFPALALVVLALVHLIPLRTAIFLSIILWIILTFVILGILVLVAILASQDNEDGGDEEEVEYLYK